MKTNFQKLLAFLRSRKQNIGFHDAADGIIEIECDRPPHREQNYTILGLRVIGNEIYWSIEPMEKREGKDCAAASWRGGEERMYRAAWRRMRNAWTPKLRERGLRFTKQVAEIHTLNPY